MELSKKFWTQGPFFSPNIRRAAMLCFATIFIICPLILIGKVLMEFKFILNEEPWFNRLPNYFFYCCISTTLTPIAQDWYYNPKLKVKQGRTLWLGVACYSLLLWSGLLSNRCPSALDVYYVTTPLNVLSTHPHSCECLFGKITRDNE